MFSLSRQLDAEGRGFLWELRGFIFKVNRKIDTEYTESYEGQQIFIKV